jgi:hypothetical protein
MTLFFLFPFYGVKFPVFSYLLVPSRYPSFQHRPRLDPRAWVTGQKFFHRCWHGAWALRLWKLLLLDDIMTPVGQTLQSVTVGAACMTPEGSHPTVRWRTSRWPSGYERAKPLDRRVPRVAKRHSPKERGCLYPFCLPLLNVPPPSGTAYRSHEDGCICSSFGGVEFVVSTFNRTPERARVAMYPPVRSIPCGNSLHWLKGRNQNESTLHTTECLSDFPLDVPRVAPLGYM